MAANSKGFLYRARFSEQELLSMLGSAREQLIELGPESVASWNDNGTGATNRRDMTVAEWIDEISYSLALTNPEEYGDRQLPGMSTAAIERRY